MLETIHQIIVESVSGGFWKFIGYWLMMVLIIGVPAKLIVFLVNSLVNRPLRHRNIRKHGYPPNHCDADGDFKKKEKEED